MPGGCFDSGGTGNRQFVANVAAVTIAPGTSELVGSTLTIATSGDYDVTVEIEIEVAGSSLWDINDTYFQCDIDKNGSPGSLAGMGPHLLPPPLVGPPASVLHYGVGGGSLTAGDILQIRVYHLGTGGVSEDFSVQSYRLIAQERS